MELVRRPLPRPDGYFDSGEIRAVFQKRLSRRRSDTGGGLAMVMIAKASGASRVFVTGMGGNGLRLKKAEELGAGFIFNVERADLSERILRDTAGRGVDIAFVCAGGGGILTDTAERVRKGGTMVAFGPYSRRGRLRPQPVRLKGADSQRFAAKKPGEPAQKPGFRVDRQDPFE